MHIAKSLHAGVLYRGFSIQKRHLFSATAIWAFQLDSGKPLLEKDFWGMLAGALENGQVLDAGMPKACGEYLLAGKFFSPDGQPVEAGKISVKLGDLEKTLLIHGDRYWKPFLSGERGIAGPKPFVEMPLTWSRAFGGANVAENPLGKGAAAINDDGVELHPLPNVEYPNALVTSMKSRPTPAGMGPIPLEWPQRTRYAGTYDEHYLKTQMPGLADDVDWHFFNTAQSDQWRPEKQFWVGNEPYELQYLHPQKPYLRGQLPGVNGRIFIRRRVDEKNVIEEMPTRIDTVWLVPGSNLGMVLHRGCVSCTEENGSDINALLIAHENMADSPRSFAHYEQQLELRTDPTESYKYLLNTGPLIPEGCTCGFEEIKASSEFPLELLVKQNGDDYLKRQLAEAELKKQEQMDALQTRLTAAGLDANHVMQQLQKAQDEKNPVAVEINRLMNEVSPGLADGKPIDFTRLDLKALEKMNAFMDEFAKKQREEAMAKAAEQITALKAQARDQETLDAVAKMEKQMQEILLPPRLPRAQPEQMAQLAGEQFDRIDKEIHDLAAQGVDAKQIARLKDDLANMRERASQVKDEIKNGYRQGAHLIESARSPHEGQEPALQQQVARAIKAIDFAKSGRTSNAFVDADLAFVDFSGMDLRGLDLGNAYLEYANFTRADIRGVNFSGAILAHAIFCDTRAEGANFHKANVGATHIENSVFDDCNFEGTTLSRARIIKSRFGRAKLSASPATFLDATFECADFSGAYLYQQTFLERDLRGCIFKGAYLAESFFVKSCMDQADFSESTLDSVNFVDLSAIGTRFENAHMHNVRFVGGCKLNGATLTHATITAANLRDVDAQGANFQHSVLDGSDLSGIQLQNGLLQKCSAVQTQFNKANMDAACLQGANLYGAGFMQARLVSTNMNESNLYSANFLSATLGNTSFAGANLDQTILRDWRPA